jgi:antitoxin component YwqK of YwqJK toxin-antitoxin module
MSLPGKLIPDGAREVVAELFENGSKRGAFYELNGERVAFRCWNEDGSVAMEYEMSGVVMHGSFRTFWDNGQVHEAATYVDGKEHGTSRQYDHTGALIGIYTMDHGTGVDLWFERKGVLAEERHYLDGQRHGYERWWSTDNVTIWQEEHYQHGKQHGVFRHWNDKGNLRRGFPRYFVNGEQVTKRQYERARFTDPTLPPLLSEDNAPNRPLPTVEGETISSV